MSIIYDALRRTQEKIINVEEKPVLNKRSKKIWPVILLVCVLLTAFLYSGKVIFGFKNTDQSQQTIRKVPYLSPGLYGSAKDIAKNGKFILSGIAYDDKKSWAVINNKILKEGDFVNKALVTRISQDEVELALDKEKTIVLTANK